MNLPIMPPFMQKCYKQFDFKRQIVELPDIKVYTPPRTHPILLTDIQLKLHNEELWEKFHAETTEMIITKVGRRMYPHLHLNITGLKEHLNYCVLVELDLASHHRHKYCGSNALDENGNKSGPAGWTKAGQPEAQPDIDHRIYLHPDSPAQGAHWMKHVVNFGKLKFTNSAADRGTNVLLTSMHKYVPRIWIFQSNNIGNFSYLYSQPHASFIFKETEFVAVTAYQNEKITQLKINNNPFAKGFRETGHSRYKRKRKEEDANHPLGEMDDESSNSSLETSPLPHRAVTTMLLRNDILHNDANTGVIDGVKLSSSMIGPVQNLTSRAQNNHLNAISPTPLSSHGLYRPWLDPPRPSREVHLPPLPLLSSSTLPDLSLYNFQFSTPALLPHNFASPSQYHHFAYPNIRDWHGLYHMPWYYPPF